MKTRDKIITGVLVALLLLMVVKPTVQAASDYVSAWLRANAIASSDDTSLLVELSGSTGDFNVIDDLTVGGWVKQPPTIVNAASYTITSTGKAGYYINEYSDTGTYLMFLPSAPGDGALITIVDGDLNAGSNNGAIYPYGGSGDTIQETTSFTQNANGESTTMIYSLTNTDWQIVGGFLE